MQKPIIISCIILSSLILMDNASAFQRSLCYENLEPEGLRLKVKFLSDKPYRPNAEILREEYEIRTNPGTRQPLLGLCGPLALKLPNVTN